MSSVNVLAPFPMFFNSTGAPLDGGYIYIGTAGVNPETSPVAVYWDAALTIPAAQPIRTNGGFPARDGAPSPVYTAGNYSITVRDSLSQLVFSGSQTAQYILAANNLSDLTSPSAAMVNLGLTATASEINTALDGVTVTAAELNQLDGITLGTAAQLSKSGMQIGYGYVTDIIQHTVNTLIPWDTTKPQIGEGQAIKSITYTPDAIGSTLRISVDIPIIDTNTGGTTMTLALFVNGATDAVKSAAFTGAGAGYAQTASFVGHVTTFSLSAMTIELRAGMNSLSYNGYLNFAYTNQTLGDTAGLTISVAEIAA